MDWETWRSIFALIGMATVAVGGYRWLESMFVEIRALVRICRRRHLDTLGE